MVAAAVLAAAAAVVVVEGVGVWVDEGSTGNGVLPRRGRCRW